MLSQIDIAKRLGVSHTTVSRALRDDQRISAAARKRIHRVARELGYRPQRHAQLMRGIKSGLIGVIKTTGLVQPSVERSYFASRAIRAAGYRLLVNELHWDEHGERQAVDVMLDERVEGVLLSGLANASAALTHEWQRLRDANIPVVHMGTMPLPTVSTIIADFRQGMAAMTEHLLQRGYRRLALLSVAPPEERGTPRAWICAEQQAGFRAVTAAAGLAAAQARVLCEPVKLEWSDRFLPGHTAIRHLRRDGERPEVLICGHDDMAIGALAACHDAGWRVPRDIAVTGFDNTTLGRYARPALTTVARPSEAIAMRAVEMLLALIRDKNCSVGEELVKMPCQLVVRQSCGNTQ